MDKVVLKNSQEEWNLCERDANAILPSQTQQSIHQRLSTLFFQQTNAVQLLFAQEEAAVAKLQQQLIQKRVEEITETLEATLSQNRIQNCFLDQLKKNNEETQRALGSLVDNKVLSSRIFSQAAEDLASFHHLFQEGGEIEQYKREEMQQRCASAMEKLRLIQNLEGADQQFASELRQNIVKAQQEVIAQGYTIEGKLLEQFLARPGTHEKINLSHFSKQQFRQLCNWLYDCSHVHTLHILDSTSIEETQIHQLFRLIDKRSPQGPFTVFIDHLSFDANALFLLSKLVKHDVRINTLSVKSANLHQLECILRSCSELPQTIDLQGSYSLTDLHRFFTAIPTLPELVIHEVLLKSEEDEEYLNLLHRPELKVMGYHFAGRTIALDCEELLAQAPSIKSMRFSHLSSLTDCQWKSCCTILLDDFKRIEAIGLIGCTQLTNESLKVLARLKSLKSVELSDQPHFNEGCQYLIHLPLETVHLSHLPQLQSKYFHRFLTGCSQLNRLYIENMKQIDTSTFLSTILSRPFLRHLSLINCTQLTPQLPNQIIALVQSEEGVDIQPQFFHQLASLDLSLSSHLGSDALETILSYSYRLEQLSLKGWREALSAEQLGHSIQKMAKNQSREATSIRDLNLDGMTLSNELISELSFYCRKLQRLSVEHCPNIASISFSPLFLLDSFSRLQMIPHNLNDTVVESDYLEEEIPPRLCIDEMVYENHDDRLFEKIVQQQILPQKLRLHLAEIEINPFYELLNSLEKHPTLTELSLLNCPHVKTESALLSSTLNANPLIDRIVLSSLELRKSDDLMQLEQLCGNRAMVYIESLVIRCPILPAQLQKWLAAYSTCFNDLHCTHFQLTLPFLPHILRYMQQKKQCRCSFGKIHKSVKFNDHRIIKSENTLTLVQDTFNDT